MAEELRIKLTADVAEFRRRMEEAGKKVEDAGKRIEETNDKATETAESMNEAGSRMEDAGSKIETAGRRLDTFTQELEEVSPVFKEMSDKWKESSEKIEARFGKTGLAAKGFKLAAIAALVAVAVKAAKVAWQVAKDTAKMFDPRGFSKAQGALDKSIVKMKTAVGSFTAPIVNAINTVLSKIVDGLTFVIEKFRVAVAYITGILKTVFQPIVDGIKQVISWIQSGINALSKMIGFGDVFKASSDSASDAAESMGEVVDATSAGLASFDKLNTLDMSNAGDAEEASKIQSSIVVAEEAGSRLMEKLKGFSLAGVWENFTETAGSAWNGLSIIAHKIWDPIAEGIGGVWSGFTSALGGAW